MNSRSIDITMKFVPKGSCFIDTGRKLSTLYHMPVDLAHGCNTVGAFADGVAGSVLKKIPEAATEYHKSEKVLGSFSSSLERSNKNIRVYNFVTQKYPGGGSLSYKAITNCFLEYLQSSERNGKLLIIPEIGCGIARGDRECVLLAIKAAVKIFDGDFGSLEEIRMLIWEGSETKTSWAFSRLLNNPEAVDFFIDSVYSVDGDGIEESRNLEAFALKQRRGF